ncbi:LacI family DNA-binding transcriptional regulator [Leifsonia sp. fls2-241-R2A-40a]|uniref:LacI family DNA-binding transcriptional regulator n=1 Tax=Leifsonia sp. fls2-241-R2A-40a TaxID=3040290 RepID=UPI00254CC7BD|nr:LacI family DNA-binding transcriptional regulator [Leifsonia sp. fls2-241-R2A-40a]
MSTVPTDRVTIADIAEVAGVSVPTVSKVLNDRPGVSASTRARITALLEQHEYTPRRSPTTGMIAVVLAELTSPWSVALVGALEEAAHASGLGVILTRMRGSADESWIDLIAARAVDGVVFAVVEMSAAQRDRMQELGLPYVVIDPRVMQSTDVPTVGITHWRGAWAATAHLLELGHRRIAMVSGPLDLVFSRARVDGYRASLSSAGITVPDEYLVETEFGYEGGRDGAERLLALPVPPSAIFAASDEQALGVYEAARIRGLRIPQDLSVVGFNDVPIAQWASPPLTTVHEPIDDTARESVRILRQLIDGVRTATAVELATEIVVRQSTAPFDEKLD